jgi:hypothetical protein
LGFSGTRLLALCPTPNLEDQGVSLFIWLLPFDLSGLGDPTSRYTTAGIALRVTEACKLPHHVKVETLGEMYSNPLLINDHIFRVISY